MPRLTPEEENVLNWAMMVRTSYKGRLDVSTLLKDVRMLSASVDEMVESNRKQPLSAGCAWCNCRFVEFSQRKALQGKFYHADKGSGLSCYENAWISRKAKGQSVI